MAKYQVVYTEVITHTVVVEASTEDEAQELAAEQAQFLGEDEYGDKTESYDLESEGMNVYSIFEL